MTGKRVPKQPEATVPQAWQVQAREEAAAELVANLNVEIARAMARVANEDVDALVAERGTPQALVNGALLVLTLLWVRARHNGMAETEGTLAALQEAHLLVADLLLKAWVWGAKGGGDMPPDLQDADGVSEAVTNRDELKTGEAET